MQKESVETDSKKRRRGSRGGTNKHGDPKCNPLYGKEPKQPVSKREVPLDAEVSTASGSKDVTEEVPTATGRVEGEGVDKTPFAERLSELSSREIELLGRISKEVLEESKPSDSPAYLTPIPSAPKAVPTKATSAQAQARALHTRPKQHAKPTVAPARCESPDRPDELRRISALKLQSSLFANRQYCRIKNLFAEKQWPELDSPEARHLLSTGYYYRHCSQDKLAELLIEYLVVHGCVREAGRY